MIKKNGKIIEATERELFRVWLKTDMCEIMDFYEYVRHMKEHGTKVVGGEMECK